MKKKIWGFAGAFAASAFLVLILCCLFNILIDPFGVFGDPVWQWYRYDMVSNPRIAKISYLNQNKGKYDAFVIGGSKCSSLPVELLNEYTGRSYYSMMMYGGDFYDYEKTVYYVVSHYGAKEIVLHQSGQEMFSYNRSRENDLANMLHADVEGRSLFRFYLKFATLDLKYSLDKIKAALTLKQDGLLNTHIIPETGVYDKSERDMEPRDSAEQYLKLHPDIVEAMSPAHLSAAQQNLASLQRITDYCKENGVKLTFVVGATSKAEYAGFYTDEYADYLRQAAEITGYWDFSGVNSVSENPLNFYDRRHYHNDVGKMIVDKMFGKAADVPEDFGRYVQKRPAELPVLLYHSITADASGNSSEVTAEKFERDLKGLRDAGYSAVTAAELLAFAAEPDSPLPEKPVLITFDDGYRNNYDIAYPLLHKYGMHAVIHVIGWSFGHDSREDGSKIIPHFGAAEAREMLSSGVIELGAHTYMMHEQGGERDGVLQRAGESGVAYDGAFQNDLQKVTGLLRSLGQKQLIFAWPYGLHSDKTDAWIKESGYTVSFVTGSGINRISDPDDLYNLKRISVSQNESAAEAIIAASDQ